ncbi:tetratricopeptide repeat protein [Leeia sp. TBRC 13508]|uniref:Tetratricopeptide repeat protein n=1 Tax=Leeia speluncae TaxID=2884804 RepID=A0ABS8D754_9NEIS|nr:tetratricopeptide repeat protein [Leeia speluncae]MCB6183483.1 tetratricopeptide repeat protein [Leeia speluncae]
MKKSSLLALPLLIALAGNVFADEAQEISKLIKQGQTSQALDRANQFLTKSPRDAQVRFAKGLALAELGRAPEAIKVFQGLTQDFPELPEPYNNLAVLYAQQKQYDKARQALQMAIQTHPSYATAHENLGDIYAEMASQAYSKALQIDKTNANAQTKLTLVRELFSRKVGGGKTAPSADPVKVNTIAAVDIKPKAPETKPAEPKTTEPTAVASNKPAENKSVENKLPTAKPVEPTKVAAAKPIETKPTSAADTKATTAKTAEKSPDDSKQVLRSVDAWAQAWSGQKVSSYLGAYGKDFRPPKGQNRKAWEEERRDRLSAPKSIAVDVSDANVTFVDGNTAKVTFKQSYKSDSLSSTTGKTLMMTKSGDRWVITEERVGR